MDARNKERMNTSIKDKDDYDNDGSDHDDDHDRYMISSFGRRKRQGRRHQQEHSNTVNRNRRGALNDSPHEEVDWVGDPYHELFGDDDDDDGDGDGDDHDEEKNSRMNHDSGHSDDPGDDYHGYDERITMATVEGQDGGVDAEDDDNDDDLYDSQSLNDDSSHSSNNSDNDGSNEEYADTSYLDLFENEYGGSHINNNGDDNVNDGDNFDEKIGLNEAMLESLHQKLMALDKEIALER